jgi:hypothetical protein
VGIYISVKFQQSLPLHRTSVWSISPQRTTWRFTKFSLVSQTISKHWQTTALLCGSECSSYAAYLADADAPICCARGTFFLEESTLVPIMLSLPSVSRSPAGCPNVKNLSHILVICSSVMNRLIRKLWTEFETSYRNCILWYPLQTKKKKHCFRGIHILTVDDANSPDTLSPIMSVGGSQRGELVCVRYTLEHTPW